MDSYRKSIRISGIRNTRLCRADDRAIICSYIPTTLGWRWLEWIILIAGGAILCITLVLQSEPYGNLLLFWTARILREETGDTSYRVPMEIDGETFGQRLLTSVCRPFLMFYSELIIILMCSYLIVRYIVLFTFLEGYGYVFRDTYGISQALTSISWAGMLAGILLVACVAPIIFSWTRKEYEKTGIIAPETRLWYAILGGAPAVAVRPFWMGWTSNVSDDSFLLILERSLYTYFTKSV